MIKIGLTGSIGMGKSATAKLFAEAGLPVFDSDACVHALYARGGAAVSPIGEAFPGSVVEGAVDRVRLSALLRDDPDGFQKLEAIVHPLVALAREEFLTMAEKSGHEACILDIPLLFETGSDALADKIVVVHAPDDVRRKRVLDRPGMTAQKLDSIIARQMPDSDKIRRADFVIETSGGEDDARRQVAEILDRLNITKR